MTRESKEMMAGFIALAMLIIFAIWAFASMAGDVSRHRINGARCKSLQGEYGGGKCFKNGKEI